MPGQHLRKLLFYRLVEQLLRSRSQKVRQRVDYLVSIGKLNNVTLTIVAYLQWLL